MSIRVSLICLRHADECNFIEILIKHYAVGDTIADKISSITRRILVYDEQLCTELFLTELQHALPNPTVQGLLSGHGSDTEEELKLLHPADRFLVELMRMGHISAHVKGMLYKATFDEQYCKIKEVRMFCVCYMRNGLPKLSRTLQRFLRHVRP